VGRIAEFEVIRRSVDFVIDGFKEVGHKVFEIGEEMLSAAAKAERTEMSFKLLMGEKGGKETLEWIEKISKYTEFTDDELKGMAGGLAKVGFEGKGLSRALSASLDMAAFSGSGEAGAEAAIGALERLKRTGVVNDKALGGLGLGEKDFFKELSNRTGLGIDTLKDKIQKGTFDTEESLETLYSMIAKKTGKDLGGAGVEMSKTMSARLKHLKDIPDQFYQQLSSSNGFAKISDFTGRLVSAFDPNSELGQKLGLSLKGLTDTIGDELGKIDINDVVTKLDKGMRDIAGSIQPTIAVFKELYDITRTTLVGLNMINEFVHDFTPIGTVADLFADRIIRKEGLDGKSNLGDRMTGVSGKDLRHELRLRGGPIGMSVGDDPLKGVMSEAFMSLGRGSATGFAAGIEDKHPLVGGASAGMGNKALDALQSKIDSNSPSREFEKLGMSTGAGFHLGIERSMAATDDVMRGAFAIPTPVGGGIARGPIQVSVSVGDINVNAPGADGVQIAEQISERLKEITPGMLKSAFEQIAIQGGGTGGQ
jgi:hypothetical protein